MWSKYGTVKLPESPVVVQRNSATCVGDDGLPVRAETCATIHGTINQVLTHVRVHMLRPAVTLLACSLARSLFRFSLHHTFTTLHRYAPR